MLNTRLSVSWRVRLQGFWQRITTPVITIDDPGHLYQSRLMASLFLLTILVVIIFVLLGIVFPSLEPGASQNGIRLLSIAVLLFAWRLSLQGREEIALIAASFCLSVILCVQAAVSGGGFDVSILYYLSVLIFVCGLFATVRVTLLVFGFQLAAMLAMLLLGGPIVGVDLVLGPALFNVIMTFATIVSVRYRRQLDEQKNARIQQSENRYRTLVEGINDMIYGVSSEGLVTSINPAVSNALGWQPADMLGKPFFPFVHPDDLALVMDGFTSILEGHSRTSQELRILTRHGAYRWLECTAAPQMSNGALVGLTGFARDITARKQAELARRQTEQRLSTLVNQMPLAVIEQDLDTIITGWNPAAEQIFGYSSAEVLGKPGMTLLVPDHLRSHIGAVFKDLMAQLGPSHSINENKTKDGRSILCEWHNILLTNEDGQPVGFLCVATDITERRQVDEHRMKLRLVQEQMNVLKRFMDAVSHDFRTALSQIETSRYLLERNLPPEAVTGIRARLESISGSVRHMELQLGNLHTISALTSLHLAPHDLNQLLRHLVDARRAALDTKNLTLMLDLLPDLPPIRMDEDKMHNALLQLLDNAIAYTPSGGNIRLRTTCEGSSVRVDVMDTGIGIAPEHTAAIFDLFYRVDLARSLNTGGVGLGLSIARLVAEAHDGAVTVVSTPGQGSTFTLTLPVAEPTLVAEAH